MTTTPPYIHKITITTIAIIVTIASKGKYLLSMKSYKKPAFDKLQSR